MTSANALTAVASQAGRKAKMARLLPYASVLGIYVLLTFLTEPFFQGDTIDYVDSIAAHQQGRFLNFWEFGHLFWQPIGWAAWRSLGSLLVKLVGPDPKIQISLVLIAISWLSGLISAVILLALLRFYGIVAWASQLTVAAFISSMAFLNYSRTGCSYIPGLSLLLFSTYLMARAAAGNEERPGFQVLTAVALAGSVSLWFLYILAVPVVVFLPHATDKPYGSRFRLSVAVLLLFCLTISTAYAGVLLHLGLTDIGRISAWIRASSHGIQMGGIPRVIFGWPRSILNMGDAGRVIKRFLLHDRLNPVAPMELTRLVGAQLMAIAFFYAAVAALIFNLSHSDDGRKALTVGLAAAVPVLGFAAHWTGGAFERYLPLAPALYLLFGMALAKGNGAKWTKVLVTVFLVATVLANPITSRGTVARFKKEAEERLNDLLPRLKDGSVIFVSHNLDDLNEFSRNFPFSPANRPGLLNVYPLLTPGNSDVQLWRQEFASRVLSAWRNGGDAWISTRLLVAVPHTDWNWVEGDDSRVSWGDFYDFFSQLQHGEPVGTADGFVLLSWSFSNERLLTITLGEKPTHFQTLPAARQPATGPVRPSLISLLGGCQSTSCEAGWFPVGVVVQAKCPTTRAL